MLMIVDIPDYLYLCALILDNAFLIATLNHSMLVIFFEFCLSQRIN